MTFRLPPPKSGSVAWKPKAAKAKHERTFLSWRDGFNRGALVRCGSPLPHAQLRMHSKRLYFGRTA